MRVQRKLVTTVSILADDVSFVLVNKFIALLIYIIALFYLQLHLRIQF